MPEYLKPIPLPDHVTGAYWDATRHHKLMIQYCRDCRTNQFFPQSYCRRCLSENLEWTEARGAGNVYSFTVIHRAPSLHFEEDAPYTVALVELDEGVRILSNIVDIEPNDVKIGMRVEVVFEDVSPTISLPKFRPSARPAARGESS